MTGCLQLVKAVVFVCAWVFVFEHLNREIRLLRGEKEEVPGLENNEPEEYERPGLHCVGCRMLINMYNCRDAKRGGCGRQCRSGCTKDRS